MAKTTKPVAVVGTMVKNAIVGFVNQPADIIITNTQVEILGSKIKVLGPTKNVLMSIDASAIIVSKKLMIGKKDVGQTLEDLEARIKKIES